MANLSEFDQGFIAGRDLAVQEAITMVNSHIDRLYPGKQNTVRRALTDLECSMRSIFLSQRGRSMRKEEIVRIWNESKITAAQTGEPQIMAFSRKVGLTA